MEPLLLSVRMQNCSYTFHTAQRPTPALAKSLPYPAVTSGLAGRKILLTRKAVPLQGERQGSGGRNALGD